MPVVRSRLVLLAVVSLSLLAGFSAPAAAQDASTMVGGVEILGPDESWGGATKAEWDARAWQWSVSMPEATNPSFDTTGERCGYGQFGPVFFIPPSYTSEPAEITCVVPEGVAIFVTVAGSECSTVEPPPYFGRDEDELRECATASTDMVTLLEASVNGEDVPDLEAYRTTSPLFTMNFPEDNFFGVEPGVAQAVADAYSFIIVPPEPGEYALNVSTMFEGETEPFTGAVTVIVEAPQVIEPEATPGATPAT